MTGSEGAGSGGWEMYRSFLSVVLQTCACLHMLLLLYIASGGPAPLSVLDGSSRRFCFVHMGLPSHPSCSVCAIGVATPPLPFTRNYNC